MDAWNYWAFGSKIPVVQYDRLGSLVIITL